MTTRGYHCHPVTKIHEQAHTHICCDSTSTHCSLSIHTFQTYWSLTMPMSNHRDQPEPTVGQETAPSRSATNPILDDADGSARTKIQERLNTVIREASLAKNRSPELIPLMQEYEGMRKKCKPFGVSCAETRWNTYLTSHRCSASACGVYEALRGTNEAHEQGTRRGTVVFVWVGYWYCNTAPSCRFSLPYPTRTCLLHTACSEHGWDGMR
jgi:hypothetical protein